MKIRKGDKVKIITGKDSGKIGSVLRVFVKDQKVLIEGVNIVKRHVKPGAVSKEGGIVKMERPISAANVLFYDEKVKKTIKLGSKVVDGKKFRTNKETGEVL